jgi:hypothetical protein
MSSKDQAKSKKKIEEAPEEPVSTTGKGKLSLAKLEKSIPKATGDKLAELQKQLTTVKAWYEVFKNDIPQTEGELRKALKADAKKVLDKASKVIDRRDKDKIEVAENERKLIDKARKWAQMVVDCEKVIKGGKTQTEVDFDRIYDLKSEIDRIKCLDGDIEVIRKMRAEFEKIEKWHEELDKVTKYDNDGKVIETDRKLLESLINKAKSSININISQEIEEIESQLKDNQEWEAEA